MIEIRNLTKGYGNIKALNNLNFTVNKGEILGFLGPNGAGKSTTMNIITGFIPLTAGTVKVCGYDILESPREAKKHIGYLPEQPPLYQDMTVIDYLDYVSDLKFVSRKQRKSQLSDIIDLVRLGEVRNRLIRNLSKGYRQRVGLAQALVGAPEVIILDEPTVGLDPKQIIEIRELIKALGKEHTVILSSHILPEVSAVCERVVIINKGSIIAEDTPANLSRSFSGSSRFLLSAAGPKPEVLKIISSANGITNIEFIGEKEGLASYSVETNGSLAARGDISLALAKSGYPIIELRSFDITLEDIFIQLINGGKEEKH